MNFLVIGGGSIGKRHISNLKKSGYSTVYCLKRNPDKAFELETGVQVITQINELNVVIDAVLVCTPTALHAEGLEIAVRLQAGVLMEKPLTDSPASLEHTKNLLLQLKRPFLIGYMLRFHPLVIKLKSLLEQNIVGPVYSARFEFGSYLPYWHPWEDYKDSYASKKELGGGVINTISHELDLIQFFFGSPKEVMCIAGNFNHLEIAVEEIAEAVFSYDDKLVSLHLDYLQKDYSRNIKFLGQDGSIAWNWHDHKIVVARHKEPLVEFTADQPFDVNQLYVDELNYFIECLEKPDQQQPLNGNYAIQNTEILIAMHASVAQKKCIQLT